MSPAIFTAMTRNAKITWAMLGLAAVLLVVWDIYAAVNNIQDTISAQILWAARKYPLLPFAVGYLMGHLFAPRPGVLAKRTEEPTALRIARVPGAAFGVGVLAGCGLVFLPSWPALPFVLGVVAGSVWWNQLRA